MMNGFGFGHGLGGGLWMILIWLIPLLLVLWGIRYFRSQTGPERPKVSASDLLDKEYAQGRIDREEYLRRRSELTDRSHLTDN